MEEIVQVFGKAGTVEWMDGVSINCDDWHVSIVRPSNTEPVLRLKR